MIVDPQCDGLFELLLDDAALARELVLREGLRERHWLPRLEAGGVGVQVCPLYGACTPGPGAAERAMAQEVVLRRAVEANADRVWVGPHARRPRGPTPTARALAGGRGAARGRSHHV